MLCGYEKHEKLQSSKCTFSLSAAPACQPCMKPEATTKQLCTKLIEIEMHTGCTFVSNQLFLHTLDYYVTVISKGNRKLMMKM